MRVRIKKCDQCRETKNTLYRCRFGESENWVFLCSECLKTVKISFKGTYQYGGTWKSEKNK